MSQAYKKIILALCFAVIIALLILVYKIWVSGKISIEQSELPLVADVATDIPIDPNDLIIGNQGALFTVTEFIDFNSSDSQKTHGAIVAFIEKNPSKMRLIVKDFPDSGLFASNAEKPHLAAFCAAKQKTGKYAAFIAEMIKVGDDLNKDDTLRTIADKVGLNRASFDACLISSEAKTRVAASVSLAKDLGLKKAPIIFINNKQVNYLEDIKLEDLLTEIIKEY